MIPEIHKRKYETRILVVEDDPVFLRSIMCWFEDKGFHVETAPAGRDGLQKFEKKRFDIAIIDLKLPDISGIEVIEKIIRIDKDVIIIAMSGGSSVEASLYTLELGVEDYLTKPMNLDHLDFVIRRGMERRRLKQDRDRLLTLSGDRDKCGDLVGSSAAMQTVYSEIRRASVTMETVLIHGQTGTGKELVARAIHNLGDRSDKPFMAMNCSGITESLLESELFGYVKGAFTGADGDKAGYFQSADGGTLLLDEIQSSSPALQASLLRVLDRKEVIPVGGRMAVPFDVRVIITSNKNLEEEVKANRFREDLYYRILERLIRVPSLSDRKDDIPVLCDHFLRQTAAEKKQPKRLSSQVIDLFMNYSWPGNIRELKNLVLRASGDSKQMIIKVSDLPEDFRRKVEVPSEFESMESVEKNHLIAALKKVNFNKTEAANILKISRSALYALIKRYNIKQDSA